MKSMNITLQADATANCSNLTMVTKWHIYPIGTTTAVYHGNTSHVTIPGRLFNYGLYLVNVTVSYQGLPVSNHSTGYIDIRPGRLVAVVSLYREGADNITIDGSGSYDNDTQSSLGLSYHWLCWSNRDVFPRNTLEYPVVSVPNPLVNIPWYHRGGCYSTGVGRLPTFGPKLVLHVPYMNRKHEYYVGLIVKKGYRQSRMVIQQIRIPDNINLTIR